MRTLFAVILALTAIACTARSQTPKPFCWNPGSGATCQRYLILELAAFTTLNTTTCCAQHYKEFDEARLSWRAGVAFNLDPRKSIGLLASVATDHPPGHGPSTIELSFRRWLTAGASAAISAGFAQGMVASSSESLLARGVTVAVDFMPWRYVGTEARADFLHAGDRNPRAFMIGAKVESYLAPIFTVLGVATLILLYAIGGGGT